MTDNTAMRVVVVTGLSGAGKSTAINALEDLGFYCVDNLPTPVVASTLEACATGGMRRVALGMDVRVRTFLDDAARTLDQLLTLDGYEVGVAFLDASDEALLRRFSSTRRPHPLTASESAASAVLDGIRIERERVAPLRARATHIVDTTLLSVHDLRRAIVAAFGSELGNETRLKVRFLSFGFKYGTPVDADLVLDVRFLVNPYFIEELREQTGEDEAVFDFVMGQADTREFLRHTEALLRFCLPKYASEGKAYLTVAIGCTGGRHRSVAIAEALRETLETPEAPIEVIHRDVRRTGPSKGGQKRGAALEETGSAAKASG